MVVELMEVQSLPSPCFCHPLLTSWLALFHVFTPGYAFVEVVPGSRFYKTLRDSQGR